VGFIYGWKSGMWWVWLSQQLDCNIWMKLYSLFICIESINLISLKTRHAAQKGTHLSESKWHSNCISSSVSRHVIGMFVDMSKTSYWTAVSTATHCFAVILVRAVSMSHDCYHDPWRIKYVSTNLFRIFQPWACILQ